MILIRIEIDIPKSAKFFSLFFPFIFFLFVFFLFVFFILLISLFPFLLWFVWKRYQSITFDQFRPLPLCMLLHHHLKLINFERYFFFRCVSICFFSLLPQERRKSFEFFRRFERGVIDLLAWWNGVGIPTFPENRTEGIFLQVGISNRPLLLDWDVVN